MDAIEQFKADVLSGQIDASRMVDLVATMQRELQAAKQRITELEQRNAELEKRLGASGTAKVDEMPVPKLLKNIQQMVLASPMYGVYQNPDHVNTDLAEFQVVTVEQIKEVLNRYVSGKKKVVIEYLPEAMKPAAETKEGKKL